jgi:hypothetical protein
MFVKFTSFSVVVAFKSSVIFTHLFIELPFKSNDYLILDLDSTWTELAIKMRDTGARLSILTV